MKKKEEKQTVNMSGFSETESSVDVCTAIFRGKKHARKNMPCQDACSTGITGDGWIVMAVADGVSSSPFSGEAARAAVEAVVTFWREFKTCFQGAEEICSVLRTSMNYALMETDRLMEGSREPYGFETTLLIVLVNRRKQEMYYSWVGDGGIYVVSKEGRVDRLTDVMRDEEEAVYTLSAGPGLWKTGSRGISDTRSILMVTDGISDVIGSKSGDFRTARLFTNREEDDSPEDFREHCREILAAPPFLDMDDDAAIALCTIREMSAAPWNIEETQEPEPGPYRSAGKDSVAGVHSPAARKGASGAGIRDMIRGVFHSIKNSRRKE